MSYMPDVPPDYVSNPSLMPRPYVTFETREAEARDAEGRTTYKEVIWAKVMPPGSKDVLEKPADEWIASLRANADARRIPPTWPDEYSKALESFKSGEELPPSGTPIRTWSALSKSQAKAVLAANILTVEDLAAANDEAKARIGMGGVSLVQMAQAWVEESKGPGAMAQKLSALTVKNNELSTQVAELLKSVAELRAQVPGATKAK